MIHSTDAENFCRTFLESRRDSFGIPGLVLALRTNGGTYSRCSAEAQGNFGFGDTIEEAVNNLLPNLQTPEQQAANLRAEAQLLIERAARIHPVAPLSTLTPLPVIRDREGVEL